MRKETICHLPKFVILSCSSLHLFLTIDFVNLQSFVVAVLAIVIATFSTGIDSKCFQVLSHLNLILQYANLNNVDLTNKILQFRKDETEEEDDVPYGYGFFHFVFATGAMYFAMLLIGWNAHHSMKKYVSASSMNFPLSSTLNHQSVWLPTI